MGERNIIEGKRGMSPLAVTMNNKNLYFSVVLPRLESEYSAISLNINNSTIVRRKTNWAMIWSSHVIS